MTGWSPRIYSLKNCELIQYKRGIESVKECNDSVIKKRYNIFDIKSVSIGPKTPYILKLEYENKFQSQPDSLLLKFNDVGPKKKYIDHLLFTTWFRILSSTSKLAFNIKCGQRPLPSPISFALYYLLQKLYKNKELFTTQKVFKKKYSSKSLVEKQYYNLIVNHKKLYQDLKDNKSGSNDDIHLLCHTLLFTMKNMPTSIFCDTYCESMTDFVMDLLKKGYEKAEYEDKNYQQRLNLPEYEDIDIYVMKRKEYLTQMKNYFLTKYSATKKQFKSDNGFNLFNRYGFLTIIMLLLCNICRKQQYDKTKMSAKMLALIFKDAFMSKRYLFKCRTELLNSQKKGGRDDITRGDKVKNEEFEKSFVKTIKIIIYFAKDIFPPISGKQKVQWKISTLIGAQGQEV